MSRIVWLSVDPVRKKIDYYPKSIAERIEAEYQIRDPTIHSTCVLGSDFFNATINFHNSRTIYQTTPGMSIGRAGYKQPGHRSVKRIVLNEDNTFVLHCKYVSGELRITNIVLEYEKEFAEVAPSACIIDSDNIDNSSLTFTHWLPVDLETEDLNKNIVIWQWCRGVPEKQGNIMALSNDWWVPYLYQQNMKIEEAFINNEPLTNIVVPFDNTIRTIKFNTNSCYATQCRYSETTSRPIAIRQIRRKIITIKELKAMFSSMNELPIDPTVLTTLVDADTIPHEFYCCISQDIMSDPVKTIDNHTYDRSSIERWFQAHDTSPLTGLHLSSKSLTPNDVLKNQIEEYTRQKLALLNNTTNALSTQATELSV